MPEILLVHQPRIPATLVAANIVAVHLEERGTSYELRSADDLEAPPSRRARLAVVLGGDGTVLRAARWLAISRPVPIVAIKMGKLSFLGEVPPDELPSGLEPYLVGDFWLDERAMLSVRTGTSERAIALNDAVLARAQCPRAIRVELLVNQAEVARYLADGVIVSTATGSTAYSLAAGGPVLAPELRSIVTTPVAPQVAALRSLVLPESAEVQLIHRSVAPALLSIDGQLERPIASNGSVVVTIAEETCSFARRGPRSKLYRNLAARLATGSSR